MARFAYDPLGRRVEKVAAGVTTTYTYDGEDVLRDVAGSSTLKYVYGPGIDEPLAQEDGAGVLSYFHADGLGSIVKTTNSAGAVIASRQYDAFGDLELGTTNGFSFTGREWDSEMGLYYYRARYYDPKIGRFISEDPIRFGGGLNFYSYVLNNPARFTDPYGLEVWPEHVRPQYPQEPSGPPTWNPWDIKDQVDNWQNPYNNIDPMNRIRHCIASCRVTRESPGGRTTSWVGGYVQDPPWWNDPDATGDRNANKTGRCLANKNPERTCESMCIVEFLNGNFY